MKLLKSYLFAGHSWYTVLCLLVLPSYSGDFTVFSNSVSVSGYGSGWGEKKKRNWDLGLSPKISSGYSYSRSIACWGYLTYNQKVLIYTTHIKKVITKLNFFILRNTITDKQEQVRNFAWQRHSKGRLPAAQPQSATPCPAQCSYPCSWASGCWNAVVDLSVNLLLTSHRFAFRAAFFSLPIIALLL